MKEDQISMHWAQTKDPHQQLAWAMFSQVMWSAESLAGTSRDSLWAHDSG